MSALLTGVQTCALPIFVTDPPYGIGITKSNRLAVSRGMGGKSWDDETPSPDFIASMVDQAKQAIIWGGNYFRLPETRCVLVWDKQNDNRDFRSEEQTSELQSQMSKSYAAFCLKKKNKDYQNT